MLGLCILINTEAYSSSDFLNLKDLGSYWKIRKQVIIGKLGSLKFKIKN